MKCVKATETLVICSEPTPWWSIVIAVVIVGVLLGCLIALVWADVRGTRP